jgi:hypothetical protein
MNCRIQTQKPPLTRRLGGSHRKTVIKRDLLWILEEADEIAMKIPKSALGFGPLLSVSGLMSDILPIHLAGALWTAMRVPGPTPSLKPPSGGRGMGPRNQARRLSADCPKGRQSRQALHAPGLRPGGQVLPGLSSRSCPSGSAPASSTGKRFGLERMASPKRIVKSRRSCLNMPHSSETRRYVDANWFSEICAIRRQFRQISGVS